MDCRSIPLQRATRAYPNGSSGVDSLNVAAASAVALGAA